MAQSSAKIGILGGKGTLYSNYKEAVKDYIDMYCKNYEKGCSILPPLFQPRLPESIEAGNPITKQNKWMQDIKKDESEKIIYDELKKYLGSNGERAIIFHSFDFAKPEISLILDHIFQSTSEDDGKCESPKEKRECDFVVLSPFFGILLIEVKGCDGETKPSTVREHHSKAKTQLDDASKFLRKLQENYANPDIPNIRTHKVVAFPSLKVDQIGGDEKLHEEVVYLFGDSKDVQIYDKIKQNSYRFADWLNSIKQTEAVCPHNFEALAEDMIFISVTALVPMPQAESRMQNVDLQPDEQQQAAQRKKVSSSDKILALRPEKASPSYALAIQDEKVNKQNIAGAKKRNTSAVMKVTPRRDKFLRQYAVFLTPEQDDILKAKSENQLIFGPAGTGKSVLVAAKANQSLVDEKSVLIIASNNMVQRYGKSFAHVDKEKCIIKEFNEIVTVDPGEAGEDKRSTIRSALIETAGKTFGSQRDLNEILENFSDKIRKNFPLPETKTELTRALIDRDVFIDDWCYYTRTNYSS